MTYLQMVNNLQQRLRERTTGSVITSEYSKLLGIFVNDAKREVENSWDWSGLRTSLVVPTVADQSVYTLGDSLNRVTVHDIWDDTNDHWLRQENGAVIRSRLNTDGDQAAQPLVYAYTETASDGDTQIQVWPKPDGVYNLIVRATLREGDLSADIDTTLLPSQPIVLLAYAKAIEERGEDAGVASSAQYALAFKSLSDHISMDANRYPEELCWKEV